LKLDSVVAVDVHTHAEVSCRQAPDRGWQLSEEAAGKYFKIGKRPTIANSWTFPETPKLNSPDEEYRHALLD
jgi:hypothetical protein